MSTLSRFILIAALAIPAVTTTLTAYENFKIAVYSRAYETAKMADPVWLEERWTRISQQVHVDKIYLETHRDTLIVDDATLEMAKKFFLAHGVQVAGGITFTIDEPNRFQTFCYSNPEHRAKAKQIAELTARHFDEFILDDFFFTSCKCDLCVNARGNRSWTDYRLQLMTEAARDLIIGPAKAVNPRVKVVIKYPNWYDHFQTLGFNLKDEPIMFDGIHTGTETRDADVSAQHLQPYHGYSIVRYFENISPGRNGGGWVDTYGSKYMDRYAEQLWLTLFAKARELTLFDFRLVDDPLKPELRAPWQGKGTSFDYDAMLAPFKLADGTVVKPSTYARAVGVTCEAVDKFIGKLGRPIGLKSYKPYHSSGEEFLQNFLGMAGIPIDLVPEFPANEETILLTAQAAEDSTIVAKIEAQLRAKKNVIITSGLLKLLQDRGLKHIADIEDSGRVAAVKKFTVGQQVFDGQKSILIPEITYRTNDSWELVSAIDGDNGWPLLHDADYAGGHLFVLTIPENFSDLSEIPAPVLSAVRKVVTAKLPVQLVAPGKVSLFLYDNDTFIVESFLDEPVNVQVAVGLDRPAIEDLLSGETIVGEIRTAVLRWDAAPVPEKRVMSFSLAPHSYRVFRLK
ncbi:MAG: hypothetical protein IPP19_00320 [Verrucomicrobia bacterium]|nr:hypothetical protein [Verrucomicrobiota bacterium]